MVSEAELTEQNVNELVNSTFLDRHTRLDEIVAMLLKVNYDTNILLKKFVLSQGVDTEGTSYEYTSVIRTGHVGVSYVAGNTNDVISCVINGILVDAIAKANVRAYEQIVVVPGGEAYRPNVVPLGMLLKGSRGIPVVQDSDGNLVSMMYGSEGVAVKQEATGELISVIQGSEGVTIYQLPTGELVAVMQGSEGVDVKQKASGALIAELQGSEEVAIKQQATGELVAVMKANYGGNLITVAADANGLMQTDVSKSEKISIIETDKNTHFTGAINQNEQETENLSDLDSNLVFIRGVNIQTTENLHMRLIFWAKDTFDDTDLNNDSYIDHVDLDIPSNGFRIYDGATFNQYYLNVSGLGIMYEDEDNSNELHISLQNLSSTAKSAGENIQIDILYSPRL